MMMNTVFTGGDHDRRTRWLIWAARHRQCPKCGAEPNYPCLNLFELKRTPPTRIRIQRPHNERIDPERLMYGLFYREYISSETYHRTIEEMRASD